VTVCIREQLAATIHRGLPRILHGVELIARRMPDVELCAGNRLAAAVEHATSHDESLAFAVQRNVCAALHWHGALCIKGPEECRLSHAASAVVTDVIDRRADAEHIRKQDELLARPDALLPGLGKKLNRGHPFLRRQLHLVDEFVQVANQRFGDLIPARIAGVAVGLENLIEQRCHELGTFP